MRKNWIFAAAITLGVACAFAMPGSLDAKPSVEVARPSVASTFDTPEPEPMVPRQIHKPGHCKTWLKGSARSACEACTQSGRRYYPKTGKCKR